MPGAVLVRGPRVLLRTPSARDLDEVLAMNRLSARFYRGRATPMVEPRVFAAWVLRCRMPDYAGMVICRLDDHAIVGTLNLSQIVLGAFRSAYMGYQVFAPFAGQQYMTAAMPLALRVVFRTLRLHRVEANIQPDNAPSIALVRRAGFQKEGYSPRYLKIGGRWRDHERWALTLERHRELSRKLEVRS